MPTQSVTEPSTPDPAWTVLTATLIRAILQFVAAGFTLFGMACSFCNPSSSALMLLGGALVFLSATAWSVWQKFKQARLDHAGNVASARGGQAVKVVEVKQS